jgi:hypothetical protein
MDLPMTFIVTLSLTARAVDRKTTAASKIERELFCCVACGRAYYWLCLCTQHKFGCGHYFKELDVYLI